MAGGEERSTGRQVGAGSGVPGQGSSCPTGFSRFQRNMWCSYQCMGLSAFAFTVTSALVCLYVQSKLVWNFASRIFERKRPSLIHSLTKPSLSVHPVPSRMELGRGGRLGSSRFPTPCVHAWLTRWAHHSEMSQQREGRVSEADPGFQSKTMRLLCVQLALQACPWVAGRLVDQKQGFSIPFPKDFVVKQPLGQSQRAGCLGMLR